VPGARTVLIVAADAETTRAYVERVAAPDLTSMRWFSDPDGQARGSLALDTAPTLVGIRGNRIEWTVGGVLNNPGTLEPLVKTWLAR
jgi:hypothetical protein